MLVVLRWRLITGSQRFLPVSCANFIVPYAVVSGLAITPLQVDEAGNASLCRAASTLETKHPKTIENFQEQGMKPYHGPA